METIRFVRWERQSLMGFVSGRCSLRRRRGGGLEKHERERIEVE